MMPELTKDENDLLDDKERELKKAVEDKNYAKVEKILATEVDPNFRFYDEDKKYKITLLRLAVDNKDYEMVNILLANPKTDPNVPDSSKKEMTPLMVAAIANDLHVVELLLKNKRTDPNAITSSPDHQTAMDFATKSDRKIFDALSNGEGYSLFSNRSQNEIKKNIRIYLRNKNVPQAFIEQFERGYCAGISSYAVYALWLENQPTKPNIERDDYTQFRRDVDFIANWELDEEGQDELNRLIEKFKNKEKPYQALMNYINGLEETDKEKFKLLDSLLKENERFERFIALIQYFHHIENYLPVAQGDLDKSLEDTVMGAVRDLASKEKVKNGLEKKLQSLKDSEKITLPTAKLELKAITKRILDLKKEIEEAEKKIAKLTSREQERKLTKEYAIGALFTLTQLKELLQLKEKKIVQEDRLIIIMSHNHVTSLFKKGKNYYFFDPNSPRGTVITDSANDLAKLIFEANFDGEENHNKPSPLAFKIFTFDEIPILKLRKMYPDQNEFLEKINAFYEATAKHANEESGLHMAVEAGNSELGSSMPYFWGVDGLDINMADAYGVTPLMHAAEQGYLDIVKELLLKGAEVNKVDKKGRTALMYAMKKGYLNIVEWLKKNKKTYINKPIENYVNALMDAAKKGRLAIVKKLLQNGADVNKADDNSMTALMYAAKGGHLDVVQELLRNKADVNMTTPFGLNALKSAAKAGHLDIVTELLAKIDPQSKTDAISDVIIEAAEKGYTDIMEEFCTEGKSNYNPDYDPNRVDKNGNTALMLAAQNGHYEFVKSFLTLLSKKIDLNKGKDDGATALKRAVYRGHSKIAKELLNFGAEVGQEEINYADKKTPEIARLLRNKPLEKKPKF